MTTAPPAPEDRKVFSGWSYITRAADVAECWVAQCFDFGVISIGESPLHAYDMLREAVELTLADDLNRGHDPHSRRAPDEDWAPLLRLFDTHSKIPVSSIDASGLREFAIPLTVQFVRTRAAGTPEVTPGAPFDNLHDAIASSGLAA